MLILMKMLHLFGLMLGAGGGMGSMFLAMQARRLDGPPPPALAALRRRFGMAGFIGILLLWVTGLWMWLSVYDGALLGPAFVLKLVVAAFILGVGIFGFVAMQRATPGSPPPALLRRLGPLSGVAAYLAVALAVLVFG